MILYIIYDVKTMVDEDLSIDGLLGIKHSIPSGKKAS
jgi:hypothetical protein